MPREDREIGSAGHDIATSLCPLWTFRPFSLHKSHPQLEGTIVKFGKIIKFVIIPILPMLTTTATIGLAVVGDAHVEKELRVRG